MTGIEGLTSVMHRWQIKHEAAVSNRNKLAKQAADADEAFKAAQEAQGIAQQIAATIQQQAHAAVAEIVSRCLSEIFDEPYTFRINFEQKRGKTEAVLAFERNGFSVDPLTASGGGVIDVAAFALRLAALMLSRPAARRVLFLDEPFRFLSKQYRARVRGLLEALASEMGVQFIIVTHFEDLSFGNVIEVRAD